jgi:phosphopantetheinyl transferase (holo-ACP synthase)
MNGWIPKVAVVATGLATAGVIGAIVAWGEQQGMKREVAANGEAAKECCTKAHENETNIAVIGTKLDGFKEQYEKDQVEAAKQRQAILDAVK